MNPKYTTAEPAWQAGPDDILLGVDIIELVSSSMYVDALTAYREYVQNAADAIDDAREQGLDAGRIDITIDPASRSVYIRDDGTGVPRRTFVRRMTAFGASDKRHRERRGFRGVGRLAALGHCQELVFRSQAEGESVISELRWDGRLLREMLRSSDFTGSLADAVRSITAHRTLQARTSDRFFEVELRGVTRRGNDDMLNEAVVRQYLAEVGPVPFSSEFSYGNAMNTFLLERGVRADVDIYINASGPLSRPHRDTIGIKEGVAMTVAAPEFFDIPSIDGSAGACGWVLHHDYLGAIPRAEGVRGVRLRSNNIQVGADDILVDLFPEPRFNAWSVAEVYILDRRILPNGRRDNYEQSTHFANVVNHLVPLARAITGRCRTESQNRQRMRNAVLFEERIQRDLAILKQGAITREARAQRAADAYTTLQKMSKLVSSGVLSEGQRADLQQRVRKLEGQLGRVDATDRKAAPLERLAPHRRRAYQEVFSLLYDCAPDARAARDLVDRMLSQLV
ncbi:MAG TPA: ATP-binding protein [Thermoanaerobaculia bacterium]|nr:ATP-binding protein [Thermoanaerobaculia bacterium]